MRLSDLHAWARFRRPGRRERGVAGVIPAAAPPGVALLPPMPPLPVAVVTDADVERERVELRQGRCCDPPAAD